MSAVGRPGDVANVAADQGYLARLTAVSSCHVQVAEIGVSEHFSVRGPGGGFGDEVADPAGGPAEDRNTAERPFGRSALALDQ